jgi:anti-sigma28 factor (negative regulator of flagellin synthesis)
VRKTAGDGQATPSRDPVQLSTLSAQLLSIQRGINDTPVIDTARIAELKEAISNSIIAASSTSRAA